MIKKLGRVIIGLLTILLAHSSYAGVFKCTDSAGHISYQSQPCPKKSSSTNVNIEQSSFAGLSTEDRVWVEQKKSKTIAACINKSPEVYNPNPQLFTPEYSKKYCECAANKYFTNNSITKLKALEADFPSSKNEIDRLLDSATSACRSELKPQNK